MSEHKNSMFETAEMRDMRDEMRDEGGGKLPQHATILVLIYIHTDSTNIVNNTYHYSILLQCEPCWTELSVTGLIDSPGSKDGGTIGRRQ